jgi:YHS domain-containing protein
LEIRENSSRDFRSHGVSQWFKRTINLSENMKKTTQSFLLAACALGVMALSAKAIAGPSPAPSSAMPSGYSGLGTTTIADTNTNGIPDLLPTCPVSGDKLGGDMGAPYVFSYKGQEVKLCCPSCKKDFDKDPAKYMKLIRAADKKK